MSKVQFSSILLQWTYCIAACMAIAAAVWFYFVVVSTKQMVYVPVVLTGCSVSAMFIMALSSVADILQDDEVRKREWINLYFLLTECAVRTVSPYRVFFLALWHKHKARGTSKEGKRRGSVTYGTDQAKELRCLLYGYKRAKGLVSNICKLTNQSSRTMSAI